VRESRAPARSGRGKPRMPAGPEAVSDAVFPTEVEEEQLTGDPDPLGAAEGGQAREEMVGPPLQTGTGWQVDSRGCDRCMK
jgi:hypothetical protein